VELGHLLLAHASLVKPFGKQTAPNVITCHISVTSDVPEALVVPAAVAYVRRSAVRYA